MKLFLYPMLLFLTLNVSAVKTVNIGCHHTIETIMILRAISDDDYFFSKIKPDDKRRPMLFLARQAFAQYKDHPAVVETQKILTDLQDIGGQLFQGILYAEELPGTSIKYEPTDAYWLLHKEQLKNYMKLLRQFYKNADVERFLTQHRRFYDGAVAEAHRYVNNSSIPAMEQYFGKQLASYNIYVMPLCPYGWGFSASTSSNGRKSVYAIIAPVGKTAWKDNLNDYTEYGYAGEKAKEHYRELVVHEFTHAFITDVLEQQDMKAKINQYDSLFTPALDSVMHENGYPDWWGFVNEHIVRLGHIRVAASVNNNEAEELRKADVQEYKFVLIPDGEKLIAEYERNRKKYKTIDDFLPILIQHFANISRQDINAKLSAEAK